MKRSLVAVYYLLHLLGYAYLRPQSKRHQADSVAEKAFRQEWGVYLEAIACQHPDRQLRIYFQDELVSRERR